MHNKTLRIAVIALVSIVLAQFIYSVYQKLNHDIEMGNMLSVLSLTRFKSLEGWMEANYIVEKEQNQILDEVRTIVNQNYKHIHKHSFNPGRH